ncbi:ABC transporter permease [Natrarchaeobius halalkaliphilus]|uniref:ABC transporter permease n=1 Tax=Natrarchaeobius halalkaliphilus TaxID=1679091 RepID=A0A3N6LLX6_9EURY|nr:ABC transporter permease [Natrarchaeobius halalkaliphilus]RQG90053.1 ABC transporter permease [Natrarchaeobius halalkaliphilus]
MSVKDHLPTAVESRLSSSRAISQLKDGLRTAFELYRSDRLGQFGLVVLTAFIFVAVFAPILAPYNPGERHRRSDGSLARLDGPSADHLLGTTHHGQDILSQVLISSRVSVFVGFLAAFIAVFIGTNVGLLSAYYGGWVDDLLMRIVDIAYGLPFLPFVIVLVFIFGANIVNIMLVIAAILWRDSARVVRSEVLTQKQRPYVESANAIGASDFRILYRHVFPNVLPLTVLYMAFAVAYAIMYEASIAFLGFGDPNVYSWGRMMYQAYTHGAIREAWWWVLPAGVCIMLLVSSVFFIGRTLEEITNPEIRH